jgi:hypothetical protein
MSTGWQYHRIITTVVSRMQFAAISTGIDLPEDVYFPFKFSHNSLSRAILLVDARLQLR